MPSSPTAPASRTSDTPTPSPRLADHLARVPDPRTPRGTRYPLTGLLLLAISATLAGCRGFTAIGEWAHALTGHCLTGFGLREAPGESNLRKLFSRLDAAALDAELCLYAWTRTTTIDDRRVIAVDGKTLRGSRSATQRAPHLVAALDHASGTVVAQQAVEAKSNEIPALPRPLRSTPHYRSFITTTNRSAGDQPGHTPGTLAFSCSPQIPQTGLTPPSRRTPPGQDTDFPPDSSRGAFKPRF